MDRSRTFALAAVVVAVPAAAMAVIACGGLSTSSSDPRRGEGFDRLDLWRSYSLFSCIPVGILLRATLTRGEDGVITMQPEVAVEGERGAGGCLGEDLREEECVVGQPLPEVVLSAAEAESLDALVGVLPPNDTCVEDPGWSCDDLCNEVTLIVDDDLYGTACCGQMPDRDLSAINDIVRFLSEIALAGWHGGGGADGDADIDADVDVDADADADGAAGGPLTYVASDLYPSDLRACDVDGDGHLDNAVADLGAPGSAVFAMVLASILADRAERGSRLLLHFPWVDDRRALSDASAVLVSFLGGDLDDPPNPEDDFSGSETFSSKASRPSTPAGS